MDKDGVIFPPHLRFLFLETSDIYKPRLVYFVSETNARYLQHRRTVCTIVVKPQYNTQHSLIIMYFVLPVSDLLHFALFLHIIQSNG